MEMSEKIHTLRKQQGLTLEEVGNRVGVGKSTVRKWESGQIANMRRDKIALLADALGVTPSYLMGWNEEEIETPKKTESSELIAIYTSLTEDNQHRLLDYANVLYIAQQANHN